MNRLCPNRSAAVLAPAHGFALAHAPARKCTDCVTRFAARGRRRDFGTAKDPNRGSEEWPGGMRSDEQRPIMAMEGASRCSTARWTHPRRWEGRSPLYDPLVTGEASLGAREMTVEDWGALPEDDPGELVDGRLVEEEMPMYIHEAVVAFFVALLRQWAAPRGGVVGCSARSSSSGRSAGGSRTCRCSSAGGCRRGGRR
jgi:hypothetical protein